MSSTLNLFFNTAFEDSSPLEQVADTLLTPARYLFKGHTIQQVNTEDLKIVKARSFWTNSWLATAAAVVALVPSLVIGGALKLFCLPQLVERYRALQEIEKQREALIREAEHLPLNDSLTTERWGLQDFFGKIYVISGSDERWPHVLGQFEAVGVAENEIVRFPGVDGASLPESWQRRMMIFPRNFTHNREQAERMQAGRLGCYVAHLNVLKQAQNELDDAVSAYGRAKREFGPDDARAQQAKKVLKQKSSIIVFEDNNGFGRVEEDGTVSLEGEQERFQTMMRQLPENWDMFYFHACSLMHRDVGDGLSLSYFSMLSKSMAIRGTFIDAIIEKYEEGLYSGDTIFPVDAQIAFLHPFRNIYAANRSFCYRMGSQTLVGSDFGRNERPVQMDVENPLNYFRYL